MDGEELRAHLEKYHRDSYTWALCCCSRDPGEAENVLQTVYLKVLEGKARFDGRSSFKTWLFAVIRKTAADERRRNWFFRSRLIQYMPNSEQAAREKSADENTYSSEIRFLFQQGLAALAKRQREILYLVFCHDLTLEEAAEVIGISLGSARTHYERGKKRLRPWMERSGGFE